MRRRIFNYNYKLLPNDYISKLESKTKNFDDSNKLTGSSMGYPAWNLLYYSLLCSLRDKQNAIILETGTNFGSSTIFLAQALKDSNLQGKVYSVELKPEHTKLAQNNIKSSGLEKYIELSTEDSLKFLSNFILKIPYIDFAFLDGNHEANHVIKEFEIIQDKTKIRNGKIYFDNTNHGTVREAINYIKKQYGGNFIEFENCSYNPSGNIIWQA